MRLDAAAPQVARISFRTVFRQVQHCADISCGEQWLCSFYRSTAVHHIHMHMTLRAELQGEDPVIIFSNWLQEAEKSEPNDPNAAALATATKAGLPSVRMVLVKAADQEGFSFYTNAESEKGMELAENPHAALCFHWKSLRRQVRVAGSIQPLSDETTDHYFHSRSRKSQIGAAVSQQSRPLADRTVLEDAVRQFTAEHPTGEIPRPAFWRGFLLRPERVELWIDGPDRLHDRRLFTRVDGSWTSTLLYP